jgi:hypothetical protein
MMLYYANPTGDPLVHRAMADGLVGFIDTPNQKNHRPPGIRWCADNGCYSNQFDDKYQQRWWKWLCDNTHGISLCAFATAPDVVGSAAATYERSQPWLTKIRQLGYPAAYVAQDGQELWPLPWNEFDVLFIGGTTAFKLGPVARQLANEARQRGLHVHCGRVNSLRRWRFAEAIGCDSADGTILKHGPRVNLARVLGWRRDLLDRPALFDMRGQAS